MGYPGGKSAPGVYQTLINLMPPHSLYVEPFLGGGAVMRYKRPAALNIGLDLDPEVIAGWSTGSEYGGPAAAREAPELAAVARSARSGVRHRRESPDPVPAAAGDGNGGRVLDDGNGDRTRFRFLVADGIEFLRANNLPPDALVYCDPPYLHSTRGRTRPYRFEMTDAQHEELIEVLRHLRCRVMISGYSSPMYARGLRGWNATAFQASTRGKPAAEWVWYNFDRPVDLHDYRFLGDGKREKERIRKKQRRWVDRLRVMPVLERQALLSAIAEAARNGDGRSTAAVFSGAISRSTRTPKVASLEEI